MNSALEALPHPALGRQPRSRQESRFSRRAALLVQLVLPVAFVVLAIVHVGFLDRTPNFCIYRSLFGVRCLGCGMTHAFCAVLHGDFAAAFAYNPLVIVAFPFFSALAVQHLRSFFRDLL